MGDRAIRTKGRVLVCRIGILRYEFDVFRPACAFGDPLSQSFQLRRGKLGAARRHGPGSRREEKLLSSGRLGTMTIIARSLRLRRKCFMATSAPWQRTQRISRIGLTSRTKSTFAISGRETNSNVEETRNDEFRIGPLYDPWRRKGTIET